MHRKKQVIIVRRSFLLCVFTFFVGHSSYAFHERIFTHASITPATPCHVVCLWPLYLLASIDQVVSVSLESCRTGNRIGRCARIPRTDFCWYIGCDGSHFGKQHESVLWAISVHMLPNGIRRRPLYPCAAPCAIVRAQS